MPRTSLTQRERKDNALLDKLDLYRLKRLREDGVDKEDVAHALGFDCSSTLYSRMKDPGTFTLRELHSIASVLNMNIGTMLGEGGEAT